MLVKIPRGRCAAQGSGTRSPTSPHENMSDGFTASASLSGLQHQLNQHAEKEPVNRPLAGLRARLASRSLIEQGEPRPDGH